MARSDSNPDSAVMLERAHRLAERLGLSPAERSIVATEGLRLADLAIGMLAERAAGAGVEPRPLALAGMLAVALAAVADDAEFDRGRA